MKKVDKLKADRQALNDEIWAIENKEAYEKNQQLLGRCFKYRNCFSCPESVDDYWWLYSQVIDVSLNGTVKAMQFQIDKDGRIDVRKNTFFSDSGYTEITQMEFQEAWDNCLSYINGIETLVP